MIDMYVTMGWVENGFEAYIVAYGVIRPQRYEYGHSNTGQGMAHTRTACAIPSGFVYGGFTQWIAGILSVLRGDSYSGSLFTLYGGYWMAFGVVGMISADPTAEWAQEEVKARMVHGIAGLKILFGVITFLYWTLSHRKTIILWLILPNVYMLLFLGAYSLLTGSEAAKVIRLSDCDCEKPYPSPQTARILSALVAATLASLPRASPSTRSTVSWSTRSMDATCGRRHERRSGKSCEQRTEMSC